MAQESLEAQSKRCDATRESVVSQATPKQTRKASPQTNIGSQIQQYRRSSSQQKPDLGVEVDLKYNLRRWLQQSAADDSWTRPTRNEEKVTQR